MRKSEAEEIAKLRYQRVLADERHRRFVQREYDALMAVYGQKVADDFMTLMKSPW